MATTGSRNVKLTLGVETTGAESVAGLAARLKGVATAGKDAAPGVEKLTAELTTLEQKTKDLRTAESAARAEVGLQKAARADLVDTLARLKAETDKAGKASADYSVRERQLRLEIIESRAALRSKQTALESAGTAARVAAAAEANLAAQITQASTAYRSLGAAAQSSAAQQNAANKSVTSGLAEIGGQLRTIQQLAGAAIGGSLVGGLAGDIGKTADAYAGLAARIKIVTGEGVAFNTAFQGVFDVATRTGVAVEQTGTLFTRLAEAGKQIGVSSAEALRLTESINQAVQLSGASAESSNAAIIQLIQGLQSGTLRGEELNSVLEQAPRLAKALAEGLGVATGELKKLGEAGSLTSTAVISALQGQSKALQDEFGQLPATIGRSLQNLSTEWTRYIGETDKATGASATAATAINLLASNLDTLGALLFAAGKAALAYQAVKLAQEFLGIGSAAKIATAELVALNVAQTATAGSSAAAAAGMGRFAGILSTLKVAAVVGVLANIKELGTAIGEGVAQWAGYTDGVKEAERAAKLEADAARDQAAAKSALAQSTQLAADKALGLTDVSRKLIGEFDQLKIKGESTSDAMEKIAKSLELKDISGISAAGAALDTLAIKGKISADDISAAFATGLKGVDLNTFAVNAAAAFSKSEQGARRLKGALDAVTIESLARAGTSVKELQTGFSVATLSAINDVDQLGKTLDGLGIKGDQAGKLLTVSLDKALALATTEKAVKAVIDRFEDLGKRGLLTGEQIAAGLQKAKEKIDALAPGINSLDEALSKFGIKSRDELTRTADTLQKSYAQIVNSSKVSLADKVTAFEQYSKAAIAANGGVETSEITLQREILNVRGAAIDSGKAIGDSMDQAGQRVDRLADRAREAAAGIAGLAGFADSRQERNKQVTSSFEGKGREDKLKGQGNLDGSGAFALREKQRTGTLSASDLQTAQSVFKAASGNLDVYQKNAGAFSADGAQSINTEFNSARTILEQVQALVASANAPTAPTQQSGNKTVTINMGGKSTSIGVQSQADQDALMAVLRQFESSRGAAR